MVSGKREGRAGDVSHEILALTAIQIGTLNFCGMKICSVHLAPATSSAMPTGDTSPLLMRSSTLVPLNLAGIKVRPVDFSTGHIQL